MAKLFCVVYRMGGTANFEWKRTLPADKATAAQQAADIERGGRVAYVVDYDRSVAIGLPETYEA